MKHKTQPGVHHGRITARLEHIHKRHHELQGAHLQAAADAQSEAAQLPQPPTPTETAP